MKENTPKGDSGREVGPWFIRVAYGPQHEAISDQLWGPFALASDAEECVKILAGRIPEVISATIEGCTEKSNTNATR